MDKETIIKRLEELRETRIQALANVNAIEGAIQDCLYWSNELDKVKEEKKDG